MYWPAEVKLYVVVPDLPKVISVVSNPIVARCINVNGCTVVNLLLLSQLGHVQDHVDEDTSMLWDSIVW